MAKFSIMALLANMAVIALANSSLGSNYTTSASHLLARSFKSLQDRQDGPLLCNDDGTCRDGSCCGSNGKCGYEEENCGAGCDPRSNCNAKAMCGRKSDTGSRSCGMGLCCSYTGWCGTTPNHCGQAAGFGPDKGWCQNMTDSKTNKNGYCGPAKPNKECPGGQSSRKRKIAYWQANNADKRKCVTVSASSIPWRELGVTHLYYAFGAIDPTTFKMVDDPRQEKQNEYKAFTANGHPGGLKTFIAIGGFDFTNPGGDPDAENSGSGPVDTHKAWSQMASTPDNRKTFIDSLIVFMNTHNFKGVDLDWEYPVAEDRGGTDDDTGNFVSLVQEMRDAFDHLGNTDWDISVALAPDYWYMRYFDAKGMEPHVSWFNFMTYDLHGAWDSDIKYGKVVRGQADLTEIRNNIIPLAFADMNMSKINFGMAYYGRGYKLADPSCASMDGSCHWATPNDAGNCTKFPGMLSYTEIQSTIDATGAQPVWDKRAGMKYITWQNSQGETNWIGYDDPDTWEQKATFADQYCFGGQAFWSIDFMGDTSPADKSDDSNKETNKCPDLLSLIHLDDVVNKVGSVPTYCLLVALLPILGKMLDDANDKFNKLLPDFQSKYHDFEDYVHMTMESVVDITMWQGAAVKDIGIGFGPAWKFFDCTIYMLDGRNWGSPMDRYTNVRCDSLTEWVVFGSDTGVEFKLRDADGYWDEMKKHSITKDMLSFNNTREIPHYCTDMPMGETPIRNCPVDGHTLFRNYPGSWGMPVASPLDKFGLMINDAKTYNIDTIKSAVRGLQSNLQNIISRLQDDSYDESVEDTAIAFATSVFLFMESVDGMDTAIQQANEDWNIRHKEYIDNVLQILNIVLSGLGLAAGPVGAVEGFIAKVANAINTVVMIVSFGEAIASIALHPDDWFNDLITGLMAISGMAMTESPKTMGSVFAKVSNGWREHINSERAGQIGPTFKSNRDKLNKVLGGSCKK